MKIIIKSILYYPIFVLFSSCILFKSLGIPPINSVSEADLVDVVTKSAVEGWILGHTFNQIGEENVPSANSFIPEYQSWILTIVATTPDKNVRVTRYYTKSSAKNCAEGARSATLYGTLILLSTLEPGKDSTDSINSSNNQTIREDAINDYGLSALYAPEWAWTGCRNIMDEAGDVVELGFFRDDH